MVGALGILLACFSLAHCGGGLSCEELAARAAGELNDAELAGGACTTDADCTVGDYSVRCHDYCSTRVSLARSAVANVEAAQSSANDTYCEAFEQKGCRVELIPAPPCRSRRTPSARLESARSM
jgi:hypothetical protein